MTRLLFLGLGQLSRGDMTIAADFARQLPRSAFDVAFVSTAAGAEYLRGLGFAAHALHPGSLATSRRIVDEVIRDFRPDYLVAADVYTLEHSSGWSGLTTRFLRRRYGIAMATFDQYEWSSTDYLLDFYPDRLVQFPRLVEDCDLVIRNCPLNRPAPSGGKVIVSSMAGATRPDQWRLARRQRPMIFLSNSRWEYVNVVKSAEMQRLIEAMPRILHSHCASLGRPLSIFHVGPVPWGFAVADHIDYHHVSGLPPAQFNERLAASDLFLTANATSVTLTNATLAGVPSLLLQNDRTLRADSGTDDPWSWLSTVAPSLRTVHPFRVFPWGWHRFLAPVLTDNPYTDCFVTANVFDRTQVRDAMTGLLDDRTLRGALADRQHRFRAELDGLPSASQAFWAMEASR